MNWVFCLSLIHYRRHSFNFLYCEYKFPKGYLNWYDFVIREVKLDIRCCLPKPNGLQNRYARNWYLKSRSQIIHHFLLEKSMRELFPEHIVCFCWASCILPERILTVIYYWMAVDSQFLLGLVFFWHTHTALVWSFHFMDMAEEVMIKSLQSAVYPFQAQSARMMPASISQKITLVIFLIEG